jgi:hypothetical protein
MFPAAHILCGCAWEIFLLRLCEKIATDLLPRD